ncbi:MAG: 1-hydroxycarotenoid 3,4-desaturase CrtD [Pseudomonadota bacterium]
MPLRKAVVVGAGAGGLAAAVDLAAAGVDVTVVDRAETAGGKISQTEIDGAFIDAGPTVFTMRWVFDRLFEDAGARFDEALTLRPLDVLARHAWTGGGRLDLYSDVERSAEAVGAFAGPKDAAGYRAFCAESAAMFRTLCEPFILGQRPSHLGVVKRVGLAGMPGFLRQIKPMRTLWAELARHFEDPRLRQLFARYATYVGSSPFFTPATIMLVAHVEQSGVWSVDGGMKAVADAMHGLGEDLGVAYRFGAGVEEIEVDGGRARGVRLDGGERLAADAVVYAGDAQALGGGLVGGAAAQAVEKPTRKTRSLSAATWRVKARTAGFPLAHHNVFFAEDYAREFDAIFRERTVCESPTVYICAPDRDAGADVDGPERLFLLVNAPPDGDVAPFDAAAREALTARTSDVLKRCGLEFDLAGAIANGSGAMSTPDDFNARYPASGGALYGRNSHGAMATMARPGAKTRVAGLYLAGGSAHPGAGVPMATMSGRHAAAACLADDV